FRAAGPGAGRPVPATVPTTGGRATFGFSSADVGPSEVAVTAGPLEGSATVTWIPPRPTPAPPSAPRFVDASTGDGGVAVMWAAPADEGASPITHYTVTADPGGRTVTTAATDHIAWVDGLTDGVAYRFSVVAWNDAGGPGPGADVGPMTPRVAPDPATDGAGGPAGAGGHPARRAAYWMLGAGGDVYAFGTAPALGGLTLAAGVDAVDLEPTPSGNGYWILDNRGNVAAFGDAKAYGGLDPSRLVAGERPASLSATPTGDGYWVFTSKGRVVPRGDAAFFGDMSQVALNGPVLDSIPTPSGRGYYMVASDGGIFAFGDARFAGSMGDRPLNAPVRSLVPDGDGGGYWLVASDGGIFAFDAAFRGSMGTTALNQPITGMVRYGNGYLMAASDGGVFDFSDLPFVGSLGGQPPPRPVVALAAG
ncbi:MAG TPA: fibronectin type III domain-containing protein, partial [Acidimicrobiia bacterium]|nr:fibronectin type III domain-containing protein [Acidimicrobiia bacterium]